MTMTRRELLSASAAIVLAPALGGRAWAAPLPREADIVVIGAGAAGIAAARRIAAANRRVLVVEAASQIGGRCLTDTATFEASRPNAPSPICAASGLMAAMEAFDRAVTLLKPKRTELVREGLKVWVSSSVANW